MIMKPGLRKLALTAHVTSSVGWLGAVASFLVLAIAGLIASDGQIVRAAYLATELVTWYVIVPFALASLFSGVVQSLGTTWGLFRHYWVLAKLLIAVAATLILILHTQAIGLVAAAAADVMLTPATLRPMRIQLVADAGAAVAALLVATALSVYKPWGVTAYGWRKMNGVARERRSRNATPGWVYVCGGIAVLFVLVVVVMHLTGRGLGGH
jgi:hypothetical protein